MRRKKVLAGLLSLALMITTAALPEGDSGREQVQAAGKGAAASATETYACVHDPSVVKDTATGRYYIFGSHKAWAYSEDLQNWKNFSNNLNKDFKSIFKNAASWAAMGTSDYDVSGNLWAPDVLWNPTMKKWCMYMSVNGPNWNSSIVLLTADRPDGDWTLVGPVVFSGFTEAERGHDYKKTDYEKATGESSLSSRYLTPNGAWNTDYGAHAIDPCVFFAEDGTLYMTYGSWSGGIYMLKLDQKTGLRDYATTYVYKDNVSDPYMGLKISGGHFVSGEASYIQKIGSYYYLFVTYGGLTANGGYNMRVFRAKNPTGPYVDEKGHDARATAKMGNVNSDIGVRMMSYYRWNYMGNGYAAQGHNSAFVDEDGKAYLVYHARTTNSGEKHQVRVHQLFVNEDGWLTTAPFDYSGETLQKVNAGALKGTYEIMFHTSVAHFRKAVVKNYLIQLKANGTITGEKTGSWRWSAKGNPYVDITIGGVTYKGMFVSQRIENSAAVGSADWAAMEKGKTAMTLTALGTNQIQLWGYDIKASFGQDRPTFVAAAKKKKGIKITWDGIGNAKGYYVYRKIGSGKWKKLKKVKGATKGSYTDKKVKKGKKYSYRVTAYTLGDIKSKNSKATKKIKWKKK